MQILNYINGQLQPPASGKYLDNINPATGKVYSQVPDSDERDVQAAIRAAEKAFMSWSKTTVETRVSYLRAIAQKIHENLNDLAMAESIDCGKPLSVAKSVDIPRSQANFEFFADCVTQFNGETYRTNHQAINHVTYSPVGVVACISPWNLPLYLFTWKIAPALAAGNTVVAKPSELTPMTAFKLSQICMAVGLPKGVLNIIHGVGSRVGTPMVTHSSVKAVSFTGSTATGQTIAAATATSFKKLSLEMGGKNANIIFADCDLEKAVATTVKSSFSNQGQICLCGSRIFVEKPIYEKFKKALVTKTQQLKQADPMDLETEQGALVSEAHMNKVLGFIELAQKEGGRILCGGQRNILPGEFSSGFYVQPTLIEGLSNESEVNQQEIFGPVATLIPFETEDQVIQMANGTRYGLAFSVWTENIKKANRVAQKLDCGIVWINTWMLRDLRTPFGGTKDSGLGREGGMHALEFMSEVKNICTALE